MLHALPWLLEREWSRDESGLLTQSSRLHTVPPSTLLLSLSLFAVHFLICNLFVLTHADPGCTQPWAEQLYLAVGSRHQTDV